jgi:hypothetical protein
MAASWVQALGGTAPYVYSWHQTGLANNDTLENLAPGTYQLTLIDANLCQFTDSITVGAVPAMSLSGSSQDATCLAADGAATVSVMGGTAPFSYSWHLSSPQTTATATGLPQGTYTVTVTDALTCSEQISIQVDSVSNLDLQFSKTDASCQLQNGSIQVQPLGGTLPFTYSWHQSGLPAQDQVLGLGAGTYAVTLTDGNGCEATDSISLSNSPAISLSGSSQDATCQAADGSATVNVSGGTAPFSYSWHLSSPQTTATATGLPQGTYTVTVTDALACSEQISIQVDSVSNLDLQFSKTDASCQLQNGSIQVQPLGGTLPFTYSWHQSGLPAQDQVLGLGAGTYAVTLTDGNGCEATDSISLSNSPAISLSGSSQDATCQAADGSATVSVSGGTAPFSYSWHLSSPQTTATATRTAPRNLHGYGYRCAGL